MSNETDSSGLGLIAGLVLAGVVIFLAIGLGPRLFNAGSSPDVNANITAPTVPTPTVPKGSS